MKLFKSYEIKLLILFIAQLVLLTFEVNFLRNDLNGIVEGLESALSQSGMRAEQTAAITSAIEKTNSYALMSFKGIANIILLINLAMYIIIRTDKDNR